jgi:membrane protein required for colicin V production
MNWLDIVIIVILVISAVSGFISGLIKTVFSLVGLILGVFLAGKFYVGLSGSLDFIPGDNGSRIAAFIIIFLVVMLIATLLGIILTKLISAVMLGWINRLGGAVLGLFLGAVFAASILAILVKVTGPGDVLTSSKLASVLLDKLPFIMGLLPSEFNSVRDFFK